jgi:hypothetical protein
MQVSKVLQAQARETDLAARYGGEEFAVILPETTKRAAVELAERVRSQLEGTPIQLQNGERHRITASQGVATFPRDSYTADKLIEGADQALYWAKQRGRNRVEIFTPSTFVELSYAPGAKEVESVSVVGNFNGWNVKADPMVQQADGSWRNKIFLVPGTYEYKFVVNGDQWICDPRCPDSVGDGYWGKNSIVTVTSRQNETKNA